MTEHRPTVDDERWETIRTVLNKAPGAPYSFALEALSRLQREAEELRDENEKLEAVMEATRRAQTEFDRMSLLYEITTTFRPRLVTPEGTEETDR